MERRPIPKASPVSRFYWEKAAEGELWLQKCQECSKFIFYPRVICPQCFGDKLEWVPASGKGKVYTYTVIYRTDLAAFAHKLPYIYAIVELDEGPRMSANVINCPADEVHVGLPVEVVFEEIEPGVKLPQFQPCRS